MLFDIVRDPHEQSNLANTEESMLNQGRAILEEWVTAQLNRALDPKRDPLDIVLAEGGPYHVRGHLHDYLRRLEETGRSQWVEPLLTRHTAGSVA